MDTARKLRALLLIGLITLGRSQEPLVSEGFDEATDG